MTANAVSVAILTGMTCVLAHAGTHSVDVGNTYFSPQFLFVEPGDVVNWHVVNGTHDVTSGESCQSIYGPLDSGEMDAANPDYSWTVDAMYDGEIVEYMCTEGAHCVNGNQFAALIVGGNGVLHEVTTDGYSFDPEVVVVDPGDTIVWVHGGGTHSVTFGTDCIADETFSEELGNLNPLVFWQVPADAGGTTQPYFCTPHCDWGMSASIEINGGGNDCPTDLDGNGTTNVDDLLILLGQYSTDCTAGCTADVDGNGSVNVDDLLVLLGEFGNTC